MNEVASLIRSYSKYRLKSAEEQEAIIRRIVCLRQELKDLLLEVPHVYRLILEDLRRVAEGKENPFSVFATEDRSRTKLREYAGEVARHLFPLVAGRDWRSARLLVSTVPLLNLRYEVYAKKIVDLFEEKEVLEAKGLRLRMRGRGGESELEKVRRRLKELSAVRFGRRSVIEEVMRKRKELERLKEEIVCSNMRLVYFIAQKVAGSFRVEMADIIHEGTIGLLKALEKYDPNHEKKTKFSTYATWWIRQAVLRALVDKGRFIRVPTHFMPTIQAVMEALAEVCGEEGAVEELDSEVEERVAEMTGIPLDKVKLAIQHIKPVFSLDYPLYGKDGEEGDQLVDFIADDVYAPEERYRAKEKRKVVERILRLLDERERRVLFMRFGLEDGKPKTLMEIAKEFRISKERVRQIEGRALQKLRRNREVMRMLEGVVD